MPAPDFTPYIDLSVYDKTDQDFMNDMLTNLSVSMPEWTPREGNVEMLLAEAFALSCADIGYAINRLPNGVMQVLLELFGVYRDIGLQPVATLHFDVVDATGYTIPAGTSALLTIVDGIDPVVFSLDSDLVIPAGATSGDGTATGDRYTQDANNTVGGTELSLVDTLAFVNDATFIGIVTEGRDQETDDQYLTRASQRFSELSDALCLASQFQAAALEDAAVARAKAIDNYNPASGNAPGADGGHITIAVYGSNAPVDDATKAALLATLQARAQANLAIHIIDATIEYVVVSTTVIPNSGVDPAAVTAAIQTDVSNYLSIANWNWDTQLYRNALIAVIGNASGVAYVQSLDLPATNISYTDIAPLLVAQSVTVVFPT